MEILSAMYTGDRWAWDSCKIYDSLEKRPNCRRVIEILEVKEQPLLLDGRNAVVVGGPNELSDFMRPFWGTEVGTTVRLMRGHSPKKQAV